MKAVILAGGLGTRISEETHLKPKPMVEIGGRPILWHILKIFSAHGINEFVICCGYKGYVIKEYFANYFLHMSDVTFDLKNNEMQVHRQNAESWKVTLVDTGEATQTGGRLKRVRNYIGDEDFCMTYGDGVADIDLDALLAFHRSHGKMITVSAVRPSARFGELEIDGPRVASFQEKPQMHDGWINGGYFVVEPAFFDLIAGDSTLLEREPLEKATQAGELMAYRHDGFWHCMDTKRDHELLESLWAKGAPWAV